MPEEIESKRHGKRKNDGPELFSTQRKKSKRVNGLMDLKHLITLGQQP